MPVVKLRANLGSNDFPLPLCTFKDGEEHEVTDHWAARLVGHGLAVVVLPPAPVVVESKPEPVVVPVVVPVVESKQEQPDVPAPQPVTQPKKSKEK